MITTPGKTNISCYHFNYIRGNGTKTTFRKNSELKNTKPILIRRSLKESRNFKTKMKE